jgi:hypothetical protein
MDELYNSPSILKVIGLDARSEVNLIVFSYWRIEIFEVLASFKDIRDVPVFIDQLIKHFIKQTEERDIRELSFLNAAVFKM